MLNIIHINLKFKDQLSNKNHFAHSQSSRCCPISILCHESNKHIFCRFSLVFRHHMPSFVNYCPPKVASILCSPNNFCFITFKCPCLLCCIFPSLNSRPRHIVYPFQGSICVYLEIVLAIIQKNSHIV